ncbi:MAG: helix-turn-helix domain-containing protein [Bacteroidia bacterium]|nr:helix-turn-helix domain-containing protein [Bacteroidia bacterium]
MINITNAQYEYALERIEELLPLVDDSSMANDKNAIELSIMSDIVIAYEKEHFPIEKPSVSQLIELALEQANMTQKQLALEIGVSPSRINDFIAGRAEPTLKVAKSLCKVLNIQPSAMLGL